MGLLLVLALLLLLGSCDSVCMAVVLAAWLLLSNVDGNPLRAAHEDHQQTQTIESRARGMA